MTNDGWTEKYRKIHYLHTWFRLLPGTILSVSIFLIEWEKEPCVTVLVTVKYFGRLGRVRERNLPSYTVLDELLRASWWE